MDLVLMGNAAKKEQGADTARRLFETALNLDAAHVPALLALSSVSEDGESDWLTQKAVATDPLCADAWADRSQILWRLGQIDAAREAVTRALRINPANVRARAELNRQLMNEGRWDRVIRPLEEVEFEYGKSGWLNWMLGAQCRARLLAGQDSAQACGRSFAVSGSRASLVYATAAAARNENDENSLRAGARLKARHPELTIAAFRNEINNSKQYSSEYREQMERVVYPALERSGISKG
jgi:tetratricopeptide (TPR) repeat protein